MKKTNLIPAIASATLLLSTATVASNLNDAESFLKDLLRSSATERPIKDLKSGYMLRYVQKDVDEHPGVSQADHNLAAERQIARQRAQLIREFLRADLDGNADLSAKEVRSNFLVRAKRPFRANNRVIHPTPSQIEAILEELETEFWIADLNEDRVISFAEINVHANETLDSKKGRRGYKPEKLNLTADLNGDGTITFEEMEQTIDASYHQIDTNADGILSRKERDRAAKLINSGKIAQIVRAPETTENVYSLESCVFPSVPNDADIVFIRGYEGSAKTDLAFDGSTSTVTAMDLAIPADGPPLFLVASFFDATVIRVSGNTERLQTVVSTKGKIGISGAEHNVTFAAATNCHIPWNETVADIDIEFERAFSTKLGQAPKTHIASYQIGSVDLGTKQNKNKTPLTEAQTPKGQAWARFNQYASGGLLRLDPTFVQSSVVTKKRAILPESAGVATLIENGTLVLVSGGQTKDAAMEDRNGKIRIGAKTFVPGTGSDAIFTGGLVYTEAKPKRWVGRTPEVYLATRTFTLPANLKGAHSIRIVIPEGIPVPKGDLSHSKLRRLGPGGIQAIDWDKKE